MASEEVRAEIVRKAFVIRAKAVALHADCRTKLGGGIRLRELLAPRASLAGIEDETNDLSSEFLKFDEECVRVFAKAPSGIGTSTIHAGMVVSFDSLRDSVRELIHDVDLLVRGYREERNFYRSTALSMVALVTSILTAVPTFVPLLAGSAKP